VPADKPDSDTDLFARAGASRVIFAASDGVIERTAVVPPLEAILGRLEGDADLVLVEGFAKSGHGAALRIDSTTGQAHLITMDGRALCSSRQDDVIGFADAIERAFELASGGDDVLRRLVRRAASAHGHQCPGVTLGVRMALAAARALALPLPDRGHRLSVVVETARCAADAIASATGCSVGKRTLRVEERGSLAARFFDAGSGQGVYIAVRDGARALVAQWAPAGVSPPHAQAIAYRVMPDAVLLDLRGEWDQPAATAPVAAVA
jgi:formylmethanofuran dehydrogenase subunit E